MARKSRVQLDGESAVRNLTEIHAIDVADRECGYRAGAAYHRNAGDCGRWCRAVQAARLPWPQFMHDGNLRYFASMWGFRVP